MAHYLRGTFLRSWFDKLAPFVEQNYRRYAVWGLSAVALFFFLWWTYDRFTYPVRQDLAQLIEKRCGLSVRVGSLRFGVNGVRLGDVALRSKHNDSIVAQI